MTIILPESAGENGPRNYFMTSLYKSYVARLGFQLKTPGLESDYNSDAQLAMLESRCLSR